jgi:hypothetical protein
MTRRIPLLARPTGLLLFVTALVALSSCASERPAINRVQADALSKEFFVGDIADPSDDPVFIARNFVVDASASQELVGLSSASAIERIRFQITENTLFARRAYSVIDGDGKGTTVDPNGDIIAAYAIESHFDIRRAYSSATGEELNVVEENTSDRPWNEREYFRVDWSKNLVDSPTWVTMFYGKVFGDINVTPVAYYESGDSPDAPHFEPDDGYFDITSHFSVEPETKHIWGMDIPVCVLMGWFTGSAIYSCDAQEAVVRTSYWRLDRADPDDDFEPFENTHAPREIFGNPGGLGNGADIGIFNPPRETYDPAYGFTEQGVHRYMNIHNLWQQSHQTKGSCAVDSDCERITKRKGSVCLDSGTCSIPCDYASRGDTKGANGTDDQCENDDTGYSGSEGSECSPRNRCTIPYRDRELKPVAYYVNPEMPDELQDTLDSKGKFQSRGPTEDLIYTWNQALRLAVANAREVECRRTARSGSEQDVRKQCHELYFETQGDKDAIQMMSYGGWGAPTPKDDSDILVTCHNPVRSYDPKTCGEEGYQARVGDVRKNFAIYWPYFTQAPYGGIGNWRGDPVTGQIFGAAATTIGRSATYGAAQVRDLALVALGELDFQDITDGVTAARFQKELRDGHAPTALTEEQIQRTVNGVLGHPGASAPSDVSGLTQTEALLKLGPEKLKQSLREYRDSLAYDPALAEQEGVKVRAAAEPLLGSQLELDLMTPDWLVDTVGMAPNTQIDDSLLEMVSPLRGNDYGQAGALWGQFNTALGERGVCFLDSSAPVGNPDIATVGLYFKKKYPTLSGNDLAKAVYEDLWRDTYKGIELHEIGHSLGLLHNFASSYDAMNYNPQYWQLRTQEGDATASCQGNPRGSTDTCMGPRYLDPESEDEQGRASEPRPGIQYFANTSTMEYQIGRFFESVGIGQYDVMSMGALYGRTLETFDPNAISQTDQRYLEGNLRTQLSEDWWGRWPDSNPPFDFIVHYTEMARQIDAFEPSRCRPASAKEREHAEWRIVHGKVCMPPPKDHAHWDDFVDEAPDPDGNPMTAKKLRVADGRVGGGNSRWPYRFGNDVQNSYPHVNPFDSGADLWEVTDQAIRKNEYEYPLAYFRRQRRGWDDGGLPSRTAWIFYERLRSYHWAASSTKSFLESVYDPQLLDFVFNDDNLWRPTILAQANMFHGIADTLLVPEPGDYASDNANLTIDGVTDLFTPQNQEPVLVVDPGDARFVSPDLDTSPAGGGSWDYQTHVLRAGYSVEKQLAARTLSDGRPVLSTISRDVYLDNRSMNINFRANLPEAMDRLLGGLLAEDWSNTGPLLDQSGGPSAKVAYRDFIDDKLTPTDSSEQVAFPNIGYNQQVALLIFPQLYGRINGDLTLANKMRVWLDGSISGEVNVPEAEQVRFSDPESGITYIARSYGTEVFYGQTIDKGIGSRMLERANQLMLRVYAQATDENGDPIVDDFGRPELELGDDGQPVLIGDAAAQLEFRRYVGLVDAAVQISTAFGHGPLW